MQAGEIGIEIPVFDDLETFLSHPVAQVAVPAQGQQTIRERVDIAGLNDKSVFPVPDEVACGTDLGGRDDGASSIHSFIRNKAPWLGIGGKHEDVADVV